MKIKFNRNGLLSKKTCYEVIERWLNGTSHEVVVETIDGDFIRFRISAEYDDKTGWEIITARYTIDGTIVFRAKKKIDTIKLIERQYYDASENKVTFDCYENGKYHIYTKMEAIR